MNNDCTVARALPPSLRPGDGVLESGVHATLAGVAVAFAVPLNAHDDRGASPRVTMEHALHPWVTYAILPLFAFAHAGVSLAGASLATLCSRAPSLRRCRVT